MARRKLGFWRRFAVMTVKPTIQVLTIATAPIAVSAAITGTSHPIPYALKKAVKASITPATRFILSIGTTTLIANDPRIETVIISIAESNIALG